MTQTSTASRLLGGWTGPAIDADCHVVVPSFEAIAAHLEPVMLEFASETGFQAPPWAGITYPPNAPTTVAAEWREGEHPAGASLDTLRRDLLDPLRLERAIVNCYWGLEGIRHPDFAAGLASAVNDWLVAEFLDRDERLRASLVVPSLDPAMAAAEIDRVGGHPGFVQVFLPATSFQPYGRRIWHPMFEAIQRHDLVAGLHLGGTPDAPGPTGYASWFLEDAVARIHVFQAQLVSLTAEGVFERFPELRVSLLEAGFTWLGPLLWRMDKEWKGLRRDVPWIRRKPSETIRERVKVSVQPIDAGPPEHFAHVVDWLGGAGQMLMFGTDYPHGYAHDVGRLLEVLPESEHERVMATNAREHYRL